MSNGDNELFLEKQTPRHDFGFSDVINPEEANQYTLEGTPSASGPSLSGASERLTGQEVTAPDSDPRIRMDLDNLAKEGITWSDILRSRTFQDEVWNNPRLGYDIRLLLRDKNVSEEDIFRRTVQTTSGKMVDGEYVQTQTPTDIMLQQMGRGVTRTGPALVGGVALGKAGLLAGTPFPPVMPITAVTGFLLGTVGGALVGNELEKALFPTLPYDPSLVDRGVATGAEIFGEGLGYLAAPYLLARKPFDMGAKHLMERWGNSSSRVLRGTGKGANFLQNFLRTAGEMTAKRPVAAGGAELFAIAGSALYGGGAEKALPGNLWARFTGEVLGSVFSPFSIIGNGGLAVYDGIKHLIRSSGPGGRVTNAGAKLIKMMEAIEPVVDADGKIVRNFSDPKEWIDSLENENFIGQLFQELGVREPTNLDIATTLPPEAAAILVQARKTLARQMKDPKKVNAAVEGIKDDLLTMQTLLNVMGGHSDPRILAARAKIEEDMYRAQLEADYHLKLIDAAEASDRILFPGVRPGATRLRRTGEGSPALEEFPTGGVQKARVEQEAAARTASQNIKDAVNESRQSWRNRESALFGQASELADKSGVTVEATNTYNTINELFEQADPVAASLPPRVSALLERLRPDIGENKAALEAAVKEGGNLALQRKTPTFVGYQKTLRQHRAELNQANTATRLASNRVTRLQDEVNGLEANQGSALTQARNQIGLALAEDLEGTTPASVKALNTRNQVQDWRAFSKDSNSDAAKAAANSGWTKFNDLRTTGWGQGQEQDKALQQAIATLEAIASEANAKTGRFSVSGGTWQQDYDYNTAGAGIRSATKDLANKQIALLKAQRNLLKVQKKSSSLQVQPPPSVARAQEAIENLDAEIAANKQAQLDFRRGTVDFVPSESVPQLSVMEMQNVRSDILKYLRGARVDIPNNANLARSLGKLERSLLDDMAETANNPVLSGLGPAERISARKAWAALQKAIAVSKAGNDFFTRAFKIRDLTQVDKYGAEVLPPEIYQDFLFDRSPSETGLMMDAISRAAIGVVEGSDALTRGDRFKTVRSAQVSLLRSLVSRSIDDETGLVNPRETANLLVEHATLLDNFFPDIKYDLENAQIAAARFKDAQDPNSALSKGQAKSLLLASFLGAESNPASVIADNLSGKDSLQWLRKTIREVKKANDPELSDGLVQGIFDAAWNNAGGNNRDPMSFRAFRDYLYNPLGGRRGGPSPIQMLIKEGLITDTQRIRLDRLMSDSVKAEAEIGGYVDKLEQLMSKGVNLEELTGEELVRQIELLPEKALDERLLIGDTVGAAGRDTARRITRQDELMLDNPGVIARLMIRITGSRMGASISEGVKKVLGIKGEGAQLQAAAAGAQALETAVNRTPVSAYQNIIWEALNDKDLFKALIEKGMSARDKYRISRNFIAALGAAGITAADPDPDVYRDEDIETRRSLYRSFSPGRSSRPRDPYSSTFPRPEMPARNEPERPFPGLLAPSSQEPVPVSSLPPVTAPSTATATPQRQRFAALYPFDITSGPIRAAATTPQLVAHGGPVRKKGSGILGLV